MCIYAHTHNHCVHTTGCLTSLFVLLEFIHHCYIFFIYYGLHGDMEFTSPFLSLDNYIVSTLWWLYR